VLRNDVRTHSSAAAVTADPAEGARFAALAEESDGACKVIHAFNRVRVAYISAQLPASLKPPAGARIIDVGCGAGLVTEPLSRPGAEMLGIDACDRNVIVAEGRARMSGAQVHSRLALPDDHKAGSFDAVMSSRHAPLIPQGDRRCGIWAGCRRIRMTGASSSPPPSLITASGDMDSRSLDLAGVVFNPLTMRWSINKDLGTNFLQFHRRRHVSERLLACRFSAAVGKSCQ
jgi:SAM-dependent methyltransferase